MFAAFLPSPQTASVGVKQCAFSYLLIKPRRQATMCDSKKKNTKRSSFTAEKQTQP